LIRRRFFKTPTGPNWLLLREFLSSEAAKLVIPGIVVQEALNQFPERLAEAAEGAQRWLGKLRKLQPACAELHIPPVNPEVATAAYAEALASRMQAFGAQQPSYDGIPIRNIVTRALQRCKPFDKHGQTGFRDALLWEAVLGVVRESGETVTLITGNTGDFGPHDGLAADLAADLQQLGVPANRVRVREGLARFIKEYVKPRLEQLEGIRTALQEGTFLNFDVERYFTDTYDEIFAAVRYLIEGWTDDATRFHGYYRLRAPRLATLSRTPSGCAVIDVYRIGEDHIVLAIQYAVEGSVTCDEDGDRGWNEEPPDKEFTGSVTFWIDASLVMDLQSGTVEEAESECSAFRLGSEWPRDGRT
jgi:hypothetical protein